MESFKETQKSGNITSQAAGGRVSEDRAFLLAQREKGRRGVMGSVDQVLAAREKRVQEAVKREERRRLKAKEYALEMSSTSEIPHNSSSCEDNTDNDSSDAEEAAVGGCPKKKKLPRATKNNHSGTGSSP